MALLPESKAEDYRALLRKKIYITRKEKKQFVTLDKDFSGYMPGCHMNMLSVCSME